MASQESGCGCGALLLLAVVGLLLPLLPTILAGLQVLGLLTAAFALVTGVLNGQNRRRLRRIDADAERRFAGDICRIEGG